MITQIEERRLIMKMYALANGKRYDELQIGAYDSVL